MQLLKPLPIIVDELERVGRSFKLLPGLLIIDGWETGDMGTGLTIGDTLVVANKDILNIFAATSDWLEALVS